MRLHFLLLSICMAMIAAPTFGASVALVSFDDLVSQSTQIARGEVISTNSRWNEAHTTIVTDVHVRGLETFKGASGDVVFTQLGGTVGKLKVTAEGVAPFQVGDEVIVFVKRTNVGLQITGGTQGRFDVVRDPRSGQKFVRGAVIDAAGDATGKAAPPARRQDLGSFQKKLQQQILQPDQAGSRGGQ